MPHESGLEPRLDPAKFIRVHRRTIVSIDRIQGVKALSAGDTELRLVDGTTVRASRAYREHVRSIFSIRP